jgi:hypothetical protein
MRDLPKDRDHFFRGMDEVRRFSEQINLEEFRRAVASVEGHKRYVWRVDARYVTNLYATALYSATVTRRDGRQWLYLFVPKSESGTSFFAIIRKPLADQRDEGSIIDLWNLQDQVKEGFKNNPRIKLSKKE